MQFARVSIAVLSLSFTIAAAGCFGSSSSNPVTSGPIDGTYKISGLTCNGSSTNFLSTGEASQEMVISNLTGSMIAVYNDGCVKTQGQTNTYPSGSSIAMTQVNTTCSGSSCSGSECTAQTNSNPTAQTFTYSVSGSTITFTRTSDGQDGCSSSQTTVYTATKQ